MPSRFPGSVNFFFLSYATTSNRKLWPRIYFPRVFQNFVTIDESLIIIVSCHMESLASSWTLWGWYRSLWNSSVLISQSVKVFIFIMRMRSRIPIISPCLEKKIFWLCYIVFRSWFFVVSWCELSAFLFRLNCEVTMYFQIVCCNNDTFLSLSRRRCELLWVLSTVSWPVHLVRALSFFFFAF